MRQGEKRALCWAIVFSCLCICGAILLCSFFGRSLPRGTADEEYLRDLITRVLCLIPLVILMKECYPKYSLGLQREGFLQGARISWLMYLYIAENFIEGSKVDTTIDIKGVPLCTYVLCLFAMLSVGVFEEILFRGIVLQVLWEQIEDKKRGLYIAVFGSSFLFGVAHMFNYVAGHAYLRPTIAQVFYAMFLGIFMGAVYVTCNNLWVVILLHGLFDFAAEFWEVATPNYSISMQDVSWRVVGEWILLYLPLAIAGAYLTWKKAKELA